jgi:hypothetical protein
MVAFEQLAQCVQIAALHGAHQRFVSHVLLYTTTPGRVNGYLDGNRGCLSPAAGLGGDFTGPGQKWVAAVAATRFVPAACSDEGVRDEEGSSAPRQYGLSAPRYGNT